MNLIFIIILLGNIWIWKIFKFDILSGLFVMGTSVSLYFFLRQPKKIFFISGLLLLLLSAYKMPDILKIKLAYSDQEKLLMDQRLNEYPPITFLPVAHWLEERPEMTMIYKITQNFSDVVDPNLYFFANHPRERTGIAEIEKFPYILLPLFVYGVFKLLESKKYLMFLFLLLPLVFYSLYGLRSVAEPYLIFPFIVISIFKGLESSYLQIKRHKALIATGFIILWALIFFQNLIYAIY